MPNIGDIHQGEVIRIFPFGVFIRLDNGEKGLVHISEISSGYVKNIHDFLKIGQKVTVKVIENKNREKKDDIALSIVQANMEAVKKERFEDMVIRYMQESRDNLNQLQKSREKKGNKRRKSK